MFDHECLDTGKLIRLPPENMLRYLLNIEARIDKASRAKHDFTFERQFIRKLISDVGPVTIPILLAKVKEALPTSPMNAFYAKRLFQSVMDQMHVPEWFTRLL